LWLQRFEGFPVIGYNICDNRKSCSLPVAIGHHQSSWTHYYYDTSITQITPFEQVLASEPCSELSIRVPGPVSQEPHLPYLSINIFTSSSPHQLISQDLNDHRLTSLLYADSHATGNITADTVGISQCNPIQLQKSDQSDFSK
jgi:hypothetical protein